MHRTRGPGPWVRTSGALQAAAGDDDSESERSDRRLGTYASHDAGWVLNWLWARARAGPFSIRLYIVLLGEYLLENRHLQAATEIHKLVFTRHLVCYC